MTRAEANAVARDMERCRITVTGLRSYDGGGVIDATDKRFGGAVTVYDENEWNEYKDLWDGIEVAPTAGRPPVYGERMTAHTIRMTAAQWAHVRQQGGDLSAGTRAIVQRDMEGER